MHFLGYYFYFHIAEKVMPPKLQNLLSKVPKPEDGGSTLSETSKQTHYPKI
jgi:hypothetical protein